MKRLLALSVLVFTMVAGISNSAKAISSVCFTDAFGYQYSFSNISMTSMGKYYAEGTATNIGEYDWKATIWVDVSAGNGNGKVELHVINPQGDNCFSGFTDSFVYVGAFSMRSTGYAGTGNWTSYCGADVINAGTWDASGPCAEGVKPTPKKLDISPAISGTSGKKVGAKLSQQVISSICFTDYAGFEYHLSNISMTSMGKYYGTGYADVGAGFNWNATMTADFSAGNGKGMVEIHVVNPQGDNCFSGYTDSFIYVGNASLHGESFNGSGSWTSFCGADVINAGTWTAEGPCAEGVKPTPKKLDISPAVSKKTQKEDKISLKVLPNPTSNYTQVKYNVTTAGKVNITIYNAMQQPVKVLVNEAKQVGSYTASWNTATATGAPVPNGLYRIVAVVGTSQYTGTVQVSR